MRRIVSVSGNKGGTSKTTITQMLCHRLGLLGHRALAVLTDAVRDPLARAVLERFERAEGLDDNQWKIMTADLAEARG